VVVRLAEGAPAAALAVAVAPIAPEPLVPVVSTPVKLTTVIDDKTDCENVAVTVTLSALSARKARQNFSRTRLRIRPLHQHPGQTAPGDAVHHRAVAVPFPLETNASSSSLVLK